DTGFFCFFFQAEDGIRDFHVTGVQTCALPISDNFLAVQLDKENPGTLDLYNFLCDFIHFSERHFEATKTKPKNENATFRVVVGNSNILNNEEKNIYKDNMINISNTILKISKEWANTKNII